MANTTSAPPSMSDLRHPHYILNQENWEKWRLCYLGGSRFIKRYLHKISRREDDQDFRDRLSITYSPSFAKSAVNEIKNSIFQRIHDVSRVGGPKSYQDACDVHDQRGVDLLGSAMGTFIGRDVLPELLTMGRVGIYVDMPEVSGPTLADVGDKRPYLYFYKAEDIRSWTQASDFGGSPGEFTALLLRDSSYDIDAHWVLPYNTMTRFRYLWVDPSDGFVHCRLFDEHGDPYLSRGLGYPDAIQEEVVLPIRRIPFVMLELSDSLLADVADYQISLLNLASSDMSYVIKANYPFYTEMVDFRGQSAHLKSSATAAGAGGMGMKQTTQTIFDPMTNQVIVGQESVREVRVGVAQGRQYGPGMERPGFIHPSSEPLLASMQKQAQLKDEIRQLVHLAVSSLSPRPASAESKAHDNLGLEAGLSYIGLELEHAERQIANFWASYMGSSPATVRYPKTYAILSEEDRTQMVDHLTKLLPMVPSSKFRTAVAKEIARLTLDTRVSSTEMRSILAELDDAPVILGDPQVIETDVAAGLVSLETASMARGYPEGEVARAKKDHEERILRIAIAQSKGAGVGAEAAQARGTPELGSNLAAGRQEKAESRDRTQEGTPKSRVRGTGKKLK